MTASLQGESQHGLNEDPAEASAEGEAQHGLGIGDLGTSGGSSGMAQHGLAMGSGGTRGLGSLGTQHSVRSRTRTTAESEGALDGDVVQRVLRRRNRAFKSCHERELRTNPTAAGTVTVSFTISAAGRVSGARVEGGDFSSLMTGCIARNVSRLRFPTADDVSRVSTRLAFTIED
jgi:outer membrane biosynthesis protein TonB